MEAALSEVPEDQLVPYTRDADYAVWSARCEAAAERWQAMRDDAGYLGPPSRSSRGRQGGARSRSGSARGASRPRRGMGGVVRDARRHRGTGARGGQGDVRPAGMERACRQGWGAPGAARSSRGGGPGGQGDSGLRPPLPRGRRLPRRRRGARGALGCAAGGGRARRERLDHRPSGLRPADGGRADTARDRRGDTGRPYGHPSYPSAGRRHARRRRAGSGWRATPCSTAASQRWTVSKKPRVARGQAFPAIPRARRWRMRRSLRRSARWRKRRGAAWRPRSRSRRRFWRSSRRSGSCCATWRRWTGTSRSSGESRQVRSVARGASAKPGSRLGGLAGRARSVPRGGQAGARGRRLRGVQAGPPRPRRRDPRGGGDCAGSPRPCCV